MKSVLSIVIEMKCGEIPFKLFVRESNMAFNETSKVKLIEYRMK